MRKHDTSRFFPFRTAALVVAAATLALGAAPTATGQVPAGFTDLYGELDASLSSFEAQLASAPPQSSAPLLGAVSKLASSNRNEYLLAQYLPYAVQVELDRLKTLGVRTIVLDINFPILYRPYHNGGAQYRQYLAFYQQLAREVRARGLKLVISTWVNIPTPAIQQFYDGLNWYQYSYGRMDVARTIARELRPDYLILGSEPDVEATLTGQPTDDVQHATQLIGTILSALESAGVRTMPVGAGIGTWQAGYQDFALAYSADTSLDFVDMHVYPIQMDFLQRINTIASTARVHGKAASLSESWLYKARQSELGGPIATRAFQRDMYSFWSPMDSRFVSVIAKVSQVEGFLFASPFFTDYFFDYLDYDAVKNLSFEERVGMHTVNWVTNMTQGALTETGKAYQTVLSGP